MKNSKSKLITMLFIAALVGLNMNLFAQRGQGQRSGERPGRYMAQNRTPGHFTRMDLSEEQKAEIKDLRTAHMKIMLEQRNKLAEKRARMRTLRTAENADMNEINKTVEEMGEIRIKMQKEKEKHIQNIRGLLNDEQRLIFDTAPRGKRGGKAHIRGGNMRQGYGRGHAGGRYMQSPGRF